MTAKTHKPGPDNIWPRAYLLQIYNTCIQRGAVVIEPIDQIAAKSLTQSLYRLRRRSDTSNASFITPEMHLVTVGKWKCTDLGGALPIYFSRLEDGFVLPEIKTLEGEQQLNQPSKHIPSAEELHEIVRADSSDDDFDSEAYVQSLLKRTQTVDKE